jgi:uroporphyrinogen-III synthase
MPKKPILLIKSNNKYHSNHYNFEQKGFKIINANILETEELPITQISDNFTIIITSINAIFAIEKMNIAKNNPIFTVGEISANILKDLGYKNIIYGNNSAQSLLDKIITEKLIPKTEKIIYLSGKKITINIDKELQKLGYNIQRQIIYKVNSKTLSQNLIDDLKNNKINDIALFSKNGEEVFYNICKNNNINLSNKNIYYPRKSLIFSDK